MTAQTLRQLPKDREIMAMLKRIMDYQEIGCNCCALNPSYLTPKVKKYLTDNGFVFESPKDCALTTIKW